MSERVPYRLADYRGYRYATLPAELEEHLPRWLVSGTVEGGEPLIGGRVWRHDRYVVKHFPPRRGWRGWFAGSRAIRSADLGMRLHPIRTPAPLVAVCPSRERTTRPEVLVLEYVAGRPLHLLWGEDSAAMEAFPRFLAEIARQGILLGDFHPNNALWDGEHWVLLDLDGIRHLLHRAHARRLVERQWARTWLAVERDAEVRRLFDVFVRESGLGWDAEAAWERVTTRADRWGKRGG